MTAPDQVTPQEILPMRRGWPQERHVLKHLYRWAQRWDLIVPGLPPRLRERALQAGCELIDRVQAGSTQYERVGLKCQKLLRSDHDAYYRPAYMHSVRTASFLGRVGTLGETSDRRAHVGDNGVLVISTDGSDGRPPRVVSAYRQKLSNPGQRRPVEFVRETVRLWRDMTSLAKKAPRASSGQDEKDSESP